MKLQDKFDEDDDYKKLYENYKNEIKKLTG